MLKIVRRPGTPHLIARGTIKGQRVERSTGTASPTEAKRLIPEITARILGEIENHARRHPARWQDMSFAAAMLAYIDAGKDAQHLGRVLEHFQETPLGEIDNARMARASASLYPSAAPATVRRQLYTPVKAIINFVSDPRLRAPKGDEKRTDWIWPADVERLIQQLTTQPNPYTPALVTMLFGQGLRMGEAVNLQIRDVNLAGRIAIIRNPKNGFERTVTLIPRVVAALSTLPTLQGGFGHGSQPVFRRADGEAFVKRTGRHGGQIRGPWKLAVEAIDLDAARITPHVARHTWATWYYHATKDPLRLKDQGGWRSNEYQRYCHLVTEALLPELIKFGWVQVNAGENRGRVQATSIKSTA